jgi:hypothetical protein
MITQASLLLRCYGFQRQQIIAYSSKICHMAEYSNVERNEILEIKIGWT